jgi:hypothetical protein
VGGQLAGLRRWVGANFAPLVLLALAAVLVWVAIWKVWLPVPGPGAPSRRSATLALALLALGVGTAVLGVFHARISSFQLDRSGFKVTLTPEEQEGAHVLVDELGRRGTPREAYVTALERYLAELPAGRPTRSAAVDRDGRYDELARRIASELG